MPWVHERGDVVWITTDPTAGHEQSGRRAALVLSPADYNSTVGLAVFCPISSQVKGYPFEVRVPDGLPLAGVVLADQARSLDWRARAADLLCPVPPETVLTVLQRLETFLSPCGAARGVSRV